MDITQQITAPSTSESREPMPSHYCCSACGVSMKAIWMPPVPSANIPGRWHRPGDFCEACKVSRLDQERAIREQVLINRAIRASRLSPRFRERTFKNFEVTEQNKKAYEAAKIFNLNHFGLFLFGSCGTGKTHLAAAVANDHFGKKAILFVSCPDLFMELKEEMAEKNRLKHELLNLARQVEILILDDIGVEKVSEWVREIFFLIVNHRYEHKLQTIFTSNLSLDELKNKLDDPRNPRITSRIIEMCRVIEIKGDDYRFKKSFKATTKGGPL